MTRLIRPDTCPTELMRTPLSVCVVKDILGLASGMRYAGWLVVCGLVYRYCTCVDEECVHALELAAETRVS